MISDLDAGWELDDPTERREARRYRLRLPVNIRLTAKRRWSSAILIDISTGGIQLRTRARLAVGSTVRIRLRDYDGNQFELKGQVLRAPCIPLPGGFVVRFDAEARELDPLFAQVLELPENDRAAFLASELRPHIEVAEGAD
jgi:hypothetical protein